MQLRPKSYIYKADDELRTRLGLIAQETEKIIPEVVTTDGDENKTKAINYSELVPVLINAIQQQQALIETQSQKIKMLELQASADAANREELKKLVEQAKQTLRALTETAEK